MTRGERAGGGVVGDTFLSGLDILPTAHRLRHEAPAGPLSFAERALVHELVRRWWRGDGVVLAQEDPSGLVLAAAVAGLRAGPGAVQAGPDRHRFPSGRPIHGFTPDPASTAADDLVALRVAPTLEQAWDGSPIEIAVIGGCRTAPGNAHVSRTFYAALAGGSSALVHQHLFVDQFPWIKVTMGYLKDYFRWEGQVFSSSLYRNVMAVPADVAAIDPYVEGTYEECLELHDAVDHSGIDRRYDYRWALSRAYLMALKGRPKEALDFLDSIAAAYADLLDDPIDAGRDGFRHDRAVRRISGGAVAEAARRGRHG